MVLIAGCLGLRASEIVGLQWRDFDFQKSTLLVQRGIVHGRVDDVKTEYSRDTVPIAPELVKELLEYRSRCYPTEEGWLFANPATGNALSPRGDPEEAHSWGGKGGGDQVPSRMEDVPPQL
jgi:integrase